MKKTTGLAALLLISYSSFSQHLVKKLKITILSTMLADKGRGEWGFSALVEADSLRILFDTGAYPDMVLDNAKDLGIDLHHISNLILSHSHDDHTGGWHTLRERVPDSFAKTYVGQGFFIPRERMPPSTGASNSYDRRVDSLWYVKTGGTFSMISNFLEIAPGVYLSGPIPRKYPEKNYAKGWVLKSKGTEDNVPEDISLVIATAKGLVLLSGCGHAGIINTADFVRSKMQQQKLIALVGGFHLLDANDQQIKWTANELKKAGLEYFIGAHCTGINAVADIRTQAALTRQNCVVGSIGSSFDLASGIHAGRLEK